MTDKTERPITAARTAIEAILAAIPDDDLLGLFESFETGARGVCVWTGGSGHYLGSATKGGERCPETYRRSASWDAIEGEAVYRADRLFLAAGDELTPDVAAALGIEAVDHE